MENWARLETATDWCSASQPAAEPADVQAALDAPSAWRAGEWSDQPHPWRRYLSRNIDYFLIGVPVFWLVLIPIITILGQSAEVISLASNRFLAGTLVVCLFPFGEAFFLSTWGFTPSRALMGIYIRNADGGKLSYKKALLRSFDVAFRGEGLGIPVVTLFTTLAAYNRLSDKRSAVWDETRNITVRHRRWGVMRGIVATAWVIAGLVGLAALQALQRPAVHASHPNGLSNRVLTTNHLG